jgi:demethylsterigmatocystin 6-O-methyltransferase
MQAMPAFFESINYKNPDNGSDSPFQVGHKTDLSAFDWLQKNPKNLGFFLEWMPAQREGLGTWLDKFPILQEAEGINPNRVLFVDIGGGIGHQCLELKTRYPSSTLPGRVILQDRPRTLEHALPTEGVEPLAHDFFKPQPVKGMSFS